MSGGPDTGVLRRMQEDDIPQVLAWRNHPEVRRYMYTQHEIQEDEHRRWFARASQDERRWLLIYQEEQTALGYVNVSRKSSEGVADWGFYLAPETPRGTGTRLGQAVLRYAFGELALHKLCGEVLGHNERSQRFHEKLGFVREGTLRQQHFDGTAYNDVVCYGLLSVEWTANLLESR